MRHAMQCQAFFVDVIRREAKLLVRLFMRNVMSERIPYAANGVQIAINMAANQA
jgi:hypothetical protein